MASGTIHLAMAKKYLENHQEIKKEDFFRGNIFPDAAKQDDYTHYTDLNRKPDLLSHLQGKVNLKEFLEEHQYMSDFEKGWFLHLITDYRFFHECFRKEYLEKISYQDFKNELYFFYNHINGYIYHKYNITKNDFYEYQKEYYEEIEYQENLLTKEEIDNFIKNVANIDLETYIEEIKNNKYI